MHPYSFIISLRAKHPKDDLHFLAELLDRKPRTSWVAGDARKTPKGTSLGGTRPNSYWVTRLTEEETDSETWQLEDYLEKTLVNLEPQLKELISFFETGGRMELFVSLYGDRNFGLIFSPNLLARIGEAQIELQLDIYPES